MTYNNGEQYTSVGTNINEVKRKNAASGLSYNEVKELLAKQGGQGTNIYSDTNVGDESQQIHDQNGLNN